MPKFVNICPVFVSQNVKDTVKYYVEMLGFKYAQHFDKIDNFATVYRDNIEIVIVQNIKGAIESNESRYGNGYDAYINTESLDEVETIYHEYKQKGVNVLTSPSLTDYGSLEFTFQDIDGRVIGIGLIADKQKYFNDSNLRG